MTETQGSIHGLPAGGCFTMHYGTFAMFVSHQTAQELRIVASPSGSRVATSSKEPGIRSVYGFSHLEPQVTSELVSN